MYNHIDINIIVWGETLIRAFTDHIISGTHSKQVTRPVTRYVKRQVKTSWVLLRSLGFSWVLLASLGFHWVLAGYLGFSWMIFRSLGFSWVLLGSLELSRIILGSLGDSWNCTRDTSTRGAPSSKQISASHRAPYTLYIFFKPEVTRRRVMMVLISRSDPK